jgi:NADPH:quinone reductase-like Zn-dependent oxidoreductase
MKTARIDRCGSNDNVSVADIEIPTLGATDLLVRVHAASMNPVDIQTREGKLNRTGIALVRRRTLVRRT